MKKHYKILLLTFVVELLVITYLGENGIKVESWIGNALGVFFGFLPLQILLFLLSRDEKFSDKKRMCFKIIFWYINVCYLLGIIASRFQ